MSDQVQTGLPENAYRELKPGETYTPIVPGTVQAPEVTLRSIAFGIAMNIIFSMAATYLALKVGQGIETAIPISILAVGFSGFLMTVGLRRSSLIENVNILAISTTSGIVAGGTVFTLPAIYVLKLNQPEHLDMGNTLLFLQLFLVPFLGAVLGVVFLVPFRRYFVKDMHGKLPFPEGTATNEILVAGTSGSIGQAMVLIYSFVIGAAYNWVSGTMHIFTETFSSAALVMHRAGSSAVTGWDEFWLNMTNNVKAVLSVGTGAEFLGLGFIIGVKYASIIVAGSFLSWFVIIPMLGNLPLDALQQLSPEIMATGQIEEAPRATLPADLVGTLPAPEAALEAAEGAPLSPDVIAAFMNAGLRVSADSANVAALPDGGGWRVHDPTLRREYLVRTEEGGAAIYAYTPTAGELFRPIPRNIGIGCIFAAGIISILKMSKVIVTALSQATAALFRGKGGATIDRTDEDISYPVLSVLGLGVAAAIFLYFRFMVMAGLPNATSLALISLALCLVVAFIFTTVSAWAIATISVTPISGMTVTTIIVTAVVLLNFGLPTGAAGGDRGMLIVLLVGGVVASCLSMAGTLITEFKISYWVGATPKKVQWSAILASLLASAAVAATLMVLANTVGFDLRVRPDALAAPQANLMASALQSFIGGGSVPWTLYGVGVVIAVLMNMVGVSPLAFGLGMYLPMELNTPILLGAVTAWFVNKSGRTEPVKKARNDKGILIASGLIAGAAIIGVVRSILVALGEKFPIFKDYLQRVDLEHIWGDGPQAAFTSNWVGLAAFLGLCLFVFLDCLIARAKKPPAEPVVEVHEQ